MPFEEQHILAEMHGPLRARVLCQIGAQARPDIPILQVGLPSLPRADTHRSQAGRVAGRAHRVAAGVRHGGRDARWDAARWEKTRQILKGDKDKRRDSLGWQGTCFVQNSKIFYTSFKLEFSS